MTNFELFSQTLMQLFLDLHLGLSLPLRRMLAMLTSSLLEGTPAHLTALAAALPDLDKAQSGKEQRVRRFLSNSKISPQRLLPLFVHLLRPILETLPAIILVMDRTHWKKRRRHVNVLMVSVAFRGRAIPLFWIVWERAGSSSLAQWKTVLSPVLTEFQKHAWCAKIPIILVADREFASPRLAQWLKLTFQVDSVLRIKRSAYLGDQDQTIQLRDLLAYFPRGATRSYRHVTVTQRSEFLVNVTITWRKTADEPLMILFTTDNAARAVQTYAQRFGIEPMFKDLKSNGFDLEGTKITDPKRVETLLIVMALAHILCTCEGARQEDSGEVKKNGDRAPGFVLSACFFSDSKPSNSGSEEPSNHNFSSIFSAFSTSYM
jgi:hypothetical protein